MADKDIRRFNTLSEIVDALTETGRVGWKQTYVAKNYTKQQLIDDLRRIRDRCPPYEATISQGKG